MAIWRYTDAAPDLSGLVAAIDEADAAARAASDTIAAWIAEQNAGQSGGIAITSGFDDPTGNLPAGFTQDSQQSLKVYQGTLRVFYPSVPNETRDFWIRSNTALTTDDVSLAIVIVGEQTFVADAMFIRGNSSGTDYVIVGISGDQIAIGRGSYNQATNDHTATPWKTESYSVPSGARVEVRAQGNLYRVYVNGAPTPVLSHTDVSGYPVDASHRYTGMVFFLQDGIFQTNRSAPITTFAASDIALPAYFGAGWELYRGTATAINKSSGNSVLPDNTFTVVRDSNLVDISNALVQGKIGIQQSGWYVITLRIHFNATSGYACLLYGTDPGSGTEYIMRAGADWSGLSSVSATWVLYLRAGATVRAGANNTNVGARGIIGESTGYITYFQGARMFDRQT